MLCQYIVYILNETIIKPVQKYTYRVKGEITKIIGVAGRFAGGVTYISNMKQEIVLQLLKQRNAELVKQFGVKSLSLFGSVARDEATTNSDMDLLVEFDRPVGYFGLFALQDYLEKLLGCPVDLGTPDSLKPRIRERVMGELIRVA